jgi:hypothetical protein
MAQKSMTMAGTIGLIKASPAELRAEIAWVVVSPAFQRSHDASNAVALLLRYCLELPQAGSESAFRGWLVGRSRRHGWLCRGRRATVDRISKVL